MADQTLLDLVRELNEAEKEHLDNEGPLKTRLHAAIVALCDYVGIANLWNTEE